MHDTGRLAATEPLIVATPAHQRQNISAALNAFATQPLQRTAVELLNALGYHSEKTADLGSDAETLLASVEGFRPDLGPISRDKVKASRWQSCGLLFQLTNDEIPSLALPRPQAGEGSGVRALRAARLSPSCSWPSSCKAKAGRAPTSPPLHASTDADAACSLVRCAFEHAAMRR